ncbi:citrate/2-methylcitrate synthase [Ruminococcus sp. OA3]|uniref:citrate/2-methylcitrate synthase n=1 Tax=Ruminococcus sp. OA3 TaxID=2914164 RepID=UPI001F05F39B|nr:citrate/2-methylcitrate synthase [Ruminococcus sp. OA3]MCH1982555.1 citrate/2-methylcitrate synthase [Ruminococcus sp. OA3]
MSTNHSDSNTMKIEQDKDFEELLKYCMISGKINLDLYAEYDVKRGLRDSNGKGVLTGLTEISDVCAYDTVDGRKIPSDGRLYYQGYDVMDLVKSYEKRRFGFEEVTYLLMFGELPNRTQMEKFMDILFDMQDLSGRFIRDVIMKASNANIMNAMQRCILTLYSYDDNPDDISIPNVLRQSLELIGKMPLIAVYSFHAFQHFRLDKNLLIRNPERGLSVAENILHMLREDGKYTELEAKVLDIALVLHTEHGGGNNSTFTTHVVTSTGTDTYSAIAASIGSLKGPRHGGANLKVQDMFANIMENCPNWTDEAKIRTYLNDILDKKAFDNSGLIYGMGHAVYTESDPRCVILKEYARSLAKEKGLMEQFALYELVEKNAGELIMNKRKLFKPVCANVDFYSGFVYTMLGIPRELFTPIFAIARISGWCAHRLEELVNQGKIIRPAYKYVGTHKQFEDIDER